MRNLNVEPSKIKKLSEVASFIDLKKNNKKRRN